MASNTICMSCIRTLRSQTFKDAQHNLRSTNAQSRVRSTSISHRQRSFSTLPTLRQSNVNTQATAKTPPLEPSKDAIASFAASVRNRQSLKSTTEPYIAYGSTEELFKECAKQCSYTVPNALKQPPEPAPKNIGGEDIGVGEGWWYEPKAQGGLELDVTFNTWAQVMYLHMYLLTVRLRTFPAEHVSVWNQNLLDHFFYAAEDRMAMWHGMAARGIRNKYLKDLLQQWRGILFSYDEGLIKGDAVLATAIWRNLFKANVETDIGDLAQVTAYVRSQLQMLDGVSDEKLASGEIKFSDPRTLKAIMDKPSPLMQKAFTEEELKTVETGSSQ